MKTKAKIILKSLAELPADAVAFVASVPERAVEATRQVLVPPAKSPPTTQHRAPFGSLVLAPAYLSANPQAPVNCWPRGGLNE